MEINICHRLIKYGIASGHSYCRHGVITEDVPKGLYATRAYNKGDIVRRLEGYLALKPTRESIHIGNGMHVIDQYGKYINHSFEPNTRIVSNDVIAIKEINQYDEITFNYNESEINMKEPFIVDGIEVCGIKT